MDFLEKLTNFAKVFYVIRALNKKSRQSLRVSPESPFDWKFFKVGSMIVYSFVRNIPNLQVCRLGCVIVPKVSGCMPSLVSTCLWSMVINDSPKLWYSKILHFPIWTKPFEVYVVPYVVAISEKNLFTKKSQWHGSNNLNFWYFHDKTS